MRFTVDEITVNKATWEKRIEKERACPIHGSGLCGCKNGPADGAASPMTRSYADLSLTKKDNVVGAQTTNNGTKQQDSAAAVTDSDDPFSKGSNGRTNLNPFNSARLRDRSPTKKKRSSPEKLEDKVRPQSSPARGHARTDPDDTELPPALPMKDFPAALALQDFTTSPPLSPKEDDDEHSHHANGTVNESAIRNGDRHGKAYMKPGSEQLSH